jgi:HEAT repeat protein
MPLVRRRARPAPAPEPADPAARRAAALAMTAPGDVPALLAALEAEPAAAVREAILTALVATGSEAAAEGLVALLAHEEAALRNEALEALRRIGAAARRPLDAALRHADPDMRLFAVTALEQPRAPWARERLRAVLAEEPEVNVGLAAVEALAETGEPEDAAALAAFAARFPAEPMVAFAVGVAIGQIGEGRP